MNLRWLTRSLGWCQIAHMTRWHVVVPETYTESGIGYCPICQCEREMVCIVDRSW